MEEKSFTFLVCLILIVGAAVVISDGAFHSATITIATALGTGAFIWYIENALGRSVAAHKKTN